tara:strand:+ start:418 stop:750 length:333 start_codon:yes stop_codon:yes gene_type:complete
MIRGEAWLRLRYCVFGRRKDDIRSRDEPLCIPPAATLVQLLEELTTRSEFRLPVILAIGESASQECGRVQLAERVAGFICLPIPPMARPFRETPLNSGGWSTPTTSATVG